MAENFLPKYVVELPLGPGQQSRQSENILSLNICRRTPARPGTKVKTERKSSKSQNLLSSSGSARAKSQDRFSESTGDSTSRLANQVLLRSLWIGPGPFKERIPTFQVDSAQCYKNRAIFRRRLSTQARALRATTLKLCGLIKTAWGRIPSKISGRGSRDFRSRAEKPLFKRPPVSGPWVVPSKKRARPWKALVWLYRLLIGLFPIAPRIH